MGKRRVSNKRRHVKKAGVARRCCGRGRPAARSPKVISLRAAETADAGARRSDHENRIFFALLMAPVVVIAAAITTTHIVAPLVQIARTAIEPLDEVGFLLDRPLRAVANFGGTPAQAAIVFGRPVREIAPKRVIGEQRAWDKTLNSSRVGDVLFPTAPGFVSRDVRSSPGVRENSQLRTFADVSRPRLVMSEVLPEISFLVFSKPGERSEAGSDMDFNIDFEPDSVPLPFKYEACNITENAPARQFGVVANGADHTEFGIRLARAARQQTRSLVVYNDAYIPISYPSGDIPSFYGVCTDVVVRAYRVLGIDLQELVRNSGSGIGDSNIDHRRVKTLHRFFSRYGDRLPITTFAEDYKAGDIVIYRRSPRQGSRPHIAIVSNVMAASGRRMIIHNRGWGPQLEDALFADKITGHFRFYGLKTDFKRIGLIDIQYNWRRKTEISRVNAAGFSRK